MSEKRMVYAEDVIQRIRDMAPEILGGWYNPYMENELEQLVCIVESTPTAAVPDVQRWRKTAEEPPTEKDSAHGKVLVKYMDATFAQSATWAHRGRCTGYFSLWMPMRTAGGKTLMTLGFAMFAATFMVAVVAAIMAVCYALVWLLRDHPIALAATTAFMIWMLAVALIYKVGGAP